jgi:hypothetical protein
VCVCVCCGVKNRYLIDRVTNKISIKQKNI